MSFPRRAATDPARVEDFPFVRAGTVPAPILSLHIGRYVRFHAACIAALVILSLAGQFCRFVLHHDKVMGFVRDFNLDDERNVPSWFQSSTLLLSACLLEIIARVRKPAAYGEWRGWRALAAGFVLMSLDEAASFHERLQLPKGALHYIPKYQAFSWVLPGLLLVILLGTFFVRWIDSLPPRTRRLMIVAGVIYVGGAVGLEAVGGIEAITIGLDNWVYVFTYTLEEAMEMTGVLLLIYTLLDYLQHLAPPLVLRLSGSGKTGAE